MLLPEIGQLRAVTCNHIGSRACVFDAQCSFYFAYRCTYPVKHVVLIVAINLRLLTGASMILLL